MTSLPVSDESDEEGGGEESTRGSYREKEQEKTEWKSGCNARWRALVFKINIQIRTKWFVWGKERIITKSGAGGKLFRLIFILFNDQQFGILPPWQIAVFWMMDCILRGSDRSSVIPLPSWTSIFLILETFLKLTSRYIYGEVWLSYIETGQGAGRLTNTEDITQHEVRRMVT